MCSFRVQRCLDRIIFTIILNWLFVFLLLDLIDIPHVVTIFFNFYYVFVIYIIVSKIGFHLYLSDKGLIVEKQKSATNVFFYLFKHGKQFLTVNENKKTNFILWHYVLNIFSIDGFLVYYFYMHAPCQLFIPC